MGKWQSDFLKAASAFLVIAALVFLLSPTTGHKLLGNRLALFMCRVQIRNWKNASTNNLSFDFSKLSEEDIRHAISFGYSFGFWAKTNFAWGINKADRELVIVCSKEFDNVPKPALWNFYHKNPAHAVGYSDGTTGLITPEQFTNLNFASFVSFSNLATNSEFNIFKQ